MDPRIRIRTKMSWIRNTGSNAKEIKSIAPTFLRIAKARHDLLSVFRFIVWIRPSPALECRRESLFSYAITVPTLIEFVWDLTECMVRASNESMQTLATVVGSVSTTFRHSGIRPNWLQVPERKKRQLNFFLICVLAS